MQNLSALMRKKIIVLDGAMGTQLQQRGMPLGVCPEQWCVTHPDVLMAIHRSYIDAGADMIYSASFGANRLKLEEYGIDSVRSLNRRLAEIARAAAGRGLVAGDVGPTGQFVAPFGPVAFETAVAVFKEQVSGLLDAGVDAIVIETMMDIQETRAALIAVRELSDIFTLVTMTFEPDGRTLNGTDPLSALITLQHLGANAVGCNCSGGPQELLQLIAAMSVQAKVPLIAKPNAGMPKLVDAQTCFDLSPADFASYAQEFCRQGVAGIGGCCGTTPRHIAALARKVRTLTPCVPRKTAVAAVSSARSSCLLEQPRPLTVVGECINPTGKKKLQAALRQGDFSLVRELARQQETAGAALLDVNAGVSGINEQDVLQQLVFLLSSCSSLPLVIDSPDPAVVEAALRVYPGRALINSISGERAKTGRLLKAAGRYGAMFICLPLSDTGIPADFSGRRRIIERILTRAHRYGLTAQDMVVDGLVLTAAAQPTAASVCLQTLEWASRQLQSNTIVGLSNISFGLPHRQLLNATFLAMAQGRGLSMVIANPLQTALMDAKRAADVLTGTDPGAGIFIQYVQRAEPPAPPDASPTAMTAAGRLSRAIVDGAVEAIAPAVADALAEADSARDLVEQVMIPAIMQVGALYEQRRYFLPQLIAGAEAMKQAFALVEPALQQTGRQPAKTTVILATVQGDIHDIGKNIVALLLRNHGFSVVDLGKDVPADTILEAVERHQAALVGLSALMTTTMVHMKTVIDRARERGLSAAFMVGGAAVSEEYARQINAGYASDGVAAVHLAQRLVRKL